MVEHSAVNRRVVGSSPTRGASELGSFGIFGFLVLFGEIYGLYYSVFPFTPLLSSGASRLRVKKSKKGCLVLVLF